MGRRGGCKGRLGAEREGLGHQGEQLNFEVRLVLLKPSEHEPGHHVCSVETLHALGVREGAGGWSQGLCGGSGAQASWANAGMWLSREKGSAQEKGMAWVHVRV